MKSRYRKHINSIVRNSPLIAFSREDQFGKNIVIPKADLSYFTEYVRLDDTDSFETTYKLKLKDMYSNVVMFTDNYLICGGHQYIYLLVPLRDGNYQVVEKEIIQDWTQAYWLKEDPHNKRNWAYIDEHVADLFEFILNSFDKRCKVKF